MKVRRLLDPLVARVKYAGALGELQSVEDTYKEIWRIRQAEYPIILIDIISAKSRNPCLTLYLDLRNYDFAPPSATLLTMDLRKRLLPENVPAVVEGSESAKGHLAGTPQTGLWFCSPGFYEYHDFYYPMDRWELIRGTDMGQLTWIVNQACNLVDRQKI